MAVSNPTYITKSKHGVYYFQLLVPDGVARKVGIQSNRYIRSLRTKDKRVALAKARKIQSRFHFLVMSTSKDKIKNQLDTLFEEDEQSRELAEIARQDELIHIAYLVDQRYEQIEPKTDLARSMFFDELTQQEQEAMQFVADKGIVLTDYSNKVDKGVVTPAQSTVDPKYAFLKGERLSVLRDKFIEHKQLEKPNWATKTREEWRRRLSLLVDVIGDLDSSKLRHEHLDSYKNVIVRLPKNRNKMPYSKGLTIEQMCQLELDDDQLLQPKTIKDYTETIKGFLNWCIKREHIASNIIVPIESFYSDAKSPPYLPFDKDDLQKLFCNHYYQNGNHATPSQYWVPLIALYSGARENEICQLQINDIQESEIGIPYFDINDIADNKLKNTDSVRQIPIHNALIKLDFLGYVQAVKDVGHKAVFPDLISKNGKYSDGFSKWFNRTYRKNCDVGIDPESNRRKTFHSFRKNTADSLRSAGADVRHIARILGHSDKTITEKHYLSDVDLVEKSKLFKGVKFDINSTKIRGWQFNKKEWFK